MENNLDITGPCVWGGNTRVLIQNSTGVKTELTGVELMGSDPVQLSWGKPGDDVTENGVKELHMMVRLTNKGRTVSDMLEGQPPGTFTLRLEFNSWVFEGAVMNDLEEREDDEYDREGFAVQAVGGLSQLMGVRFEDIDLPDGGRVPFGITTVKEVIYECVQDLGMTLNIDSRWATSTMTDDGRLLEQVFIEKLTFSNGLGGSSRLHSGWTRHEVLKTVVDAFEAVILIFNEELYMFQPNNLKTGAFAFARYSGVDGTYINQTLPIHSVLLPTGFNIHRSRKGGARRIVLPQHSETRVVYEHGEVPNLINNGSFETVPIIDSNHTYGWDHPSGMNRSDYINTEKTLDGGYSVRLPSVAYSGTNPVTDPEDDVTKWLVGKLTEQPLTNTGTEATLSVSVFVEKASDVSGAIPRQYVPVQITHVGDILTTYLHADGTWKSEVHTFYMGGDLGVNVESWVTTRFPFGPTPSQGTIIPRIGQVVSPEFEGAVTSDYVYIDNITLLLSNDQGGNVTEKLFIARDAVATYESEESEVKMKIGDPVTANQLGGLLTQVGTKYVPANDWNFVHGGTPVMSFGQLRADARLRRSRSKRLGWRMVLHKLTPFTPISTLIHDTDRYWAPYMVMKPVGYGREGGVEGEFYDCAVDTFVPAHEERATENLHDPPQPDPDTVDTSGIEFDVVPNDGISTSTFQVFDITATKEGAELDGEWEQWTDGIMVQSGTFPLTTSPLVTTLPVTRPQGTYLRTVASVLKVRMNDQTNGRQSLWRLTPVDRYPLPQMLQPEAWQYKDGEVFAKWTGQADSDTTHVTVEVYRYFEGTPLGTAIATSGPHAVGSTTEVTLSVGSGRLVKNGKYLVRFIPENQVTTPTQTGPNHDLIVEPIMNLIPVTWETNLIHTPGVGFGTGTAQLSINDQTRMLTALRWRYTTDVEHTWSNWITIDTPDVGETGTVGTDTDLYRELEVNLIEKYDVLVQWEGDLNTITEVGGTNVSTIGDTYKFDPDLIPEFVVLDLRLGDLDVNGERPVLMTLQMREDGRSIEFHTYVQDLGDPTPSPVWGTGTVIPEGSLSNNGVVDWDTGATVSDREVCHVWIKAFRGTNGTGRESREVHLAISNAFNFRLPEINVIKEEFDDSGTRKARLKVEITSDQDTVLLGAEGRSVSGTNFMGETFSALTQQPGPPVYFEMTEVLHHLHGAQIEIRLLLDYGLYRDTISWSFDANIVPQVKRVQLTRGQFGLGGYPVYAGWLADEDSQSVRYYWTTVAAGTSVAYPDEVTWSIAPSSNETDERSLLLGTVNPLEDVHLFVRAYGSTGGTGTKGTVGTRILPILDGPRKWVLSVEHWETATEGKAKWFLTDVDSEADKVQWRYAEGARLIEDQPWVDLVGSSGTETITLHEDRLSVVEFRVVPASGSVWEEEILGPFEFDRNKEPNVTFTSLTPVWDPVGEEYWVPISRKWDTDTVYTKQTDGVSEPTWSGVTSINVPAGKSSDLLDQVVGPFPGGTGDITVWCKAYGSTTEAPAVSFPVFIPDEPILDTSFRDRLVKYHRGVDIGFDDFNFVGSPRTEVTLDTGSRTPGFSIPDGVPVVLMDPTDPTNFVETKTVGGHSQGDKTIPVESYTFTASDGAYVVLDGIYWASVVRSVREQTYNVPPTLDRTGAVAFYNFLQGEDEGVLFDRSGNSNHATRTLWSPGEGGYITEGYQKTLGHRFEVDSLIPYNSPTALSVTMVVRRDKDTEYMYPFRSNYGGTNHYQILYHTDSIGRVYIYAEGSNLNYTVTQVAGDWIVIQGVWDITNDTVYLRTFGEGDSDIVEGSKSITMTPGTASYVWLSLLQDQNTTAFAVISNRVETKDDFRDRIAALRPILLDRGIDLGTDLGTTTETVVEEHTSSLVQLDDQIQAEVTRATHVETATRFGTLTAQVSGLTTSISIDAATLDYGEGNYLRASWYDGATQREQLFQLDGDVDKDDTTVPVVSVTPSVTVPSGTVLWMVPTRQSSLLRLSPANILLEATVNEVVAAVNLSASLIDGARLNVTANTTFQAGFDPSRQRVWVQASAPTALTVGDLWFDSDDGNRRYEWNGTIWDPVTDAEVTEALGRATVFYSASQPTANNVGDRWRVPGDAEAQYIWTGSQWVEDKTRIDGGMVTTGLVLAAYVQVGSATDFTDLLYNPSRTRVWHQDSAPTATTVGDQWYETDNDNILHVWNGSSWVERRDDGVVDALNDAAAAQSTADDKAKVHYSASAPGGSHSTGDIWIETDEGNRPHTWNGSSWVANYTEIDGGTIVTGTVAAARIDVDNLVVKKVSIGGSTVNMDSNGIQIAGGTSAPSSGYWSSPKTISWANSDSALAMFGYSDLSGGFHYEGVIKVGNYNGSGKLFIEAGVLQLKSDSVQDRLGRKFLHEANVDDSTIEVSSGNLRVKSSGITASHLASNSVGDSELNAGQATSISGSDELLIRPNGTNDIKWAEVQELP